MIYEGRVDKVLDFSVWSQGLQDWVGGRRRNKRACIDGNLGTYEFELFQLEADRSQPIRSRHVIGEHPNGGKVLFEKSALRTVANYRECTPGSSALATGDIIKPIDEGFPFSFIGISILLCLWFCLVTMYGKYWILEKRLLFILLNL